MKTRKKLFFTGIIIVLGVVVSWLLLGTKPGTGVSIETVQVTKGVISGTITATGTLEPITQVEVGTQVSGVIQKIYVDYNSIVSKGQRLAELDKSLLQAQVAEVKAGLASAENDLDFQKKNHARFKQLYEKKTISDADYENAYYAYANAQANVDRYKAELIRAQANLDYASIYSPIDGVVLSRAVDEGQTVAASFNTPTLFTIANDLARMQVLADVDEADIGQVKEGQRVSFTVDAFPDDEFAGTVTQVRLEPHINANVVTYSVVVEAPNPDLKLMPGLTASITVYTIEMEDIAVIPAKALHFNPDPALLAIYNKDLTEEPENDVAFKQDADHKTVYVLNNGEILQKSVQTGAFDGVNYEVTAGLSIDEQVVVAMVEASSQVESDSKAVSSPFMPKRPGSSNSKTK